MQLKVRKTQRKPRDPLCVFPSKPTKGASESVQSRFHSWSQ